MYFVKFVEADNGKVYNGEDAIDSLVHYVLDFKKISKDVKRVNTTCEICAGCSPFPFNKMLESDSEAVSYLMKTNNMCWDKDYMDVLRHRIVSFDANEFVLPTDLDILGRKFIEYYNRKGYIACYGVHRDTYNFHIHLLVNTTSYINGSKFNIYNEFSQVHVVIKAWEENYLRPKLENFKTLERYENILFGYDRLPPEEIELGAVPQIKHYKQYCNRKR